MEVHDAVSSGTLWLTISIAGAIILIAFAIIGTFVRGYMKTIHDDVKSNTLAVGKNKGGIELVRQQQENDKIHLEEMTQVKLQALADNVNILSTNVNTLVTALVGAGVKIDDT